MNGSLVMPLSYIIKETKEYCPLSALFHETGMEIKINETPPEGIVKMWRLENRKTGELIAAATLQIRNQVYALGDLAVREDHRSEGYGKLMREVVFDEARKIGNKEIWGSARVSDYYYRLGWQKIDWDSSPKVAVNCHNCGRRGKTCFPAIIKMAL